MNRFPPPPSAPDDSGEDRLLRRYRLELPNPGHIPRYDYAGMPVPMDGLAGGAMVSVGSGCQVELETIAMLSRQPADVVAG